MLDAFIIPFLVWTIWKDKLEAPYALCLILSLIFFYVPSSTCIQLYIVDNLSVCCYLFCNILMFLFYLINVNLQGILCVCRLYSVICCCTLLDGRLSCMGVYCFQESLLLDPMFEIPGSDVMSVHITEDVVSATSLPVYIRGKPVSQDEEEQTIEVQARANAK